MDDDLDFLSMPLGKDVETTPEQATTNAPPKAPVQAAAAAATPAAAAPPSAAPQTTVPTPSASRSEKNTLYNPELARRFFSICGVPEQFPKGQQIFVEQDKSSTGGLFSKKTARIYLLVDGGVALTIKNKPLDLVMPGEIFGEMAVIADMPRSATATAWKPSQLLSLDEKQFLQSLQKMPEFALMLISIMGQRLRRAIAKLIESGKQPSGAETHKSTLDKRKLAELQEALGGPVTHRAVEAEAIVNQGTQGFFMYVVLEGTVAITVNGNTVEYVGPGGIFGEMALVDGAGRAAGARAETACAWCSVTREDLLTLVRSNPAFGIALLRSMSERIQRVSAQLCA